MRITTILKEPLLHFLAIGAVLFAAHTLVAPGEGGEAKSETAIRISTADVERLGQLWARQWRRLPTPEELSVTLADFVKEEVLAREARQLKLDEDDTVVRRRLAQKMAFLLDDTVRPGDAGEAELRALYEARPDLSRAPARVSLEHIFFRGEDGQERARARLASLSDNAALSGLEGDHFLLGSVFAEEDERSLANVLGASFAQTVMSVEPGRWVGPVRSAYGLHLVKVTAISPGRVRPFDEMRDRLAQELLANKQESVKQQLFSGLLRKYEIVADPAVRPLLRPLLSEREAQR